jgi:outer membrane usher protein
VPGNKPRHVRRGRTFGRDGTAWILFAALASAGPAHADDARPEGTAAVYAAGSTDTLYLELVVNKLATGQVVEVRYQDGGYFARAGDLEKVSVRTGGAPADRFIALGALRGVAVAYDSVDQRLDLTVPADWLPKQVIGGARLYDRTPSVESPGLLLNYDIYANAPTGGGTTTVTASTEQRLLGPWGTLSNTGIARATFGGGASGQRGYLRYDTTLTYSDDDHLRVYTAGDLITGALSWTNAVRLGGLSVARDFTMRPDIVTYPMPQFAGQSAVPTAVDLFIDGSKAASGQVNPGPFTVSNVPFVTGAGEASVVTTDAMGRQVSTTIPFYVANTLLAQGLADYSAAAGAIRRNYGISSLAYGDPAASGSARYGLTDHVTVEGHIEAGDGLAVGGIGADLGVGLLGVVNLAATQSSLHGVSGQQFAYGYTYTARHFTVNLQRTQRTSGFGDLSVYDQPAGSTYRLPRSTTQATVALTPGPRWGTVGAGYFDVVDATGQATRVVNVSYTRPLFGRAILYAAFNRTIGSGSSAQLQVIVPLGRRASATASVTRDGGGESGGLRYSRSVPSEGGLGGDLALLGGATPYQQADVTWRSADFQLGGGIYGAHATGYSRWGELQGSLVVMDGDVFPANRVTDAFALVSTDGQKGVPVLYENQLLGETNSRGHLLVPWTPSYYPGKYEIDPLNLPSNYAVPVTEQHVAIKRHAGAIVRFKVERIVAARITLVDAAGAPIRMGLPVTHRESGQATLIGVGGETYFEGLAADNHLVVDNDRGKPCTASFTMDLKASELVHIGPLVCKEQ